MRYDVTIGKDVERVIDNLTIPRYQLVAMENSRYDHDQIAMLLLQAFSILKDLASELFEGTDLPKWKE